ncbi:methyl-accepting chemotaxis protein [Borreliella californiensis]|uniref:Methyl-accepting chemotaxis protein n=1 Tax=Borreliella californiensis TaxID=373543 RepID=A0A7W9ZJJ9_9SPIR|nr:methyl-accepting chemotaxis protein [Borreliella californiensis]MBB6212693.1 methyl-accepting chemotaxis protein [Borreliella californiensis]WKC91847.1 methyl-accepting chemotaxis protein [Borreliella californiensis]WNY70599.1 methyl-accepting chemotaxis protein [Borreliella californiensis]
MKKFSFFKKKKKVVDLNLLNDVGNDKKDLSTYEYKAPVKEMLKGFYHTKASISTLKVGFESLQRILFSGIEDFDQIFSTFVEMTNNARDQISVIFSDLGKNNKEKLNQISSVIVGIQGSLETISNFLGATNMISLNAKLEAARAKEYGKGFSVVADEIKRLSDQAKGVMNMISVKEIEEVSKDLISHNLNDLQIDIDKFFAEILEQLNYLESIFKRFSRSQEEFSSLIENLESIDANMAYYTRNCDSLISSATFMLSNDEFLKELEFILSEQFSWINNLRLLVEGQRSIFLQTDSSKHGFGLFYKGLSPKNDAIRQLWEEVYIPYLNINKFAAEILIIFRVENRNDSSLRQAKDFLSQAESLSEEIVRKLEHIKKMVIELDNQGISIFS